MGPTVNSLAKYSELFYLSLIAVSEHFFKNSLIIHKENTKEINV